MSYLLFFSSHFGHRKVLDRVQSAVSAGLPVHLICYDRFDIGMVREEIISLCESVQFIGSPKDGGRLSRILYWFLGFKKYLSTIYKNGFPSFVLVNNGEFFLFASLLYFGGAEKYYDLADIHSIQYKNTFISKFYRFFERVALKRKWSLVVTSPWFYWDYFVGIQNVKSRAYLVENKLTQMESITLLKNHPLPFVNDYIVTIGWTGIFRCTTSLNLLIDLCEKYPGKYNVHLIGLFGVIDSEVIDRAKNCPFIYLKGSYRSEMLGDLLKAVNYVWSVDFDDGLNSKSLLPNRIYQAIAGARPIIAFADSATGKCTSHFGVGLTFDACTVGSLHQALETFEKHSYEKTCISQGQLRGFMVRKDEFATLFSERRASVKPLPSSEDMTLVFSPIPLSLLSIATS